VNAALQPGGTFKMRRGRARIAKSFATRAPVEYSSIMQGASKLAGCEALARHSAFSLLELLIVVALIAVLTTMYWGSGSGTRQKKLQAECQNNLQRLCTSMEIFANDHESRFPDAPGAKTSQEPLDLLVPRYTSDTSIFICPGSGDSALPAGEPIRKRKISYAYYMGWRLTDAQEPLITDGQVDALPKVAGQQVFSSTGKPPGNNHGKNGGNVLFGDGHVARTPPNAAFALGLPKGVVLLNP